MSMVASGLVRRRAGKARDRRFRFAALVCAVYAATPVAGEESELIYSGVVAGRRITALCVEEGFNLSALSPRAKRGETLLIYRKDRAVSSTEPLVVWVDGEVAIRVDRPLSSGDGETIAELTKRANAGRKRLDAWCKDGTRSPTSGTSEMTRAVSSWRGCSSRGGVDRWFYTLRPDRNAIVASICKDYRLVAGDGDLCGGRRQTLVRIRNRRYE